MIRLWYMFLFDFITLIVCDYCRTPYKEPGICIVVENCTHLINIFTKQILSKENKIYLQRSHCGFDEFHQPKICCPLTNVITTTKLNHIVTESYMKTSTDSENIQNKINLLANFSECGLSTANRIIGGEFTAIDEFTWMALLIYAKPNGYGIHCAGSLINHQYILTAAHCIKGYELPKSWKLVAVRLGEYDIRTNPDCVPASNNLTDCSDPIIDIEISDIIIHEEYNPFDVNRRNDIALIRLLQYVNYTEYISPICLPITNIFKEFRNELMVSGWGKTSNGFKSRIKLKLQVPFVTKSNCNQIYQKALVNITDSQICAGGEKNKDTCRGDSGGPLMTPEINPITNVYNWFQIGIISFGSINCAAKDWPSVYTNITAFMPWILGNLLP